MARKVVTIDAVTQSLPPYVIEGSDILTNAAAPALIEGVVAPMLQGIGPVVSWTQSGNRAAAVSAVDIDTDTLTSAAHPFANGDMVTPFINIPGAALRQYLPGGMLIRAYYVVNAAADTFQLSETAGGAPLALSTRATMDLSKWHFQTYSGFFSGFTGLDGRAYRLVVRGQYVLGLMEAHSNTYWMKLCANDSTTITTSDSWGFGTGALSPSWGIGTADVVFDVRGGVASVAGSVRVMGQITTTADATLVDRTRTENNIPSVAAPPKITQLGFSSASAGIYWANGSTMEVYAL